MNDAFELLDPGNARSFLKSFEAQARRKGEAAFRTGRVHDLVAEQPGMADSAVVKDGEGNEVNLHYAPVEGWSGEFSCPEEFDCEHVFAAMRALLAEHSTGAVRNLSAGVSTPASGWGKAGQKTEEDAGGLARRLMATLGRPL